MFKSYFGDVFNTVEEANNWLKNRKATTRFGSIVDNNGNMVGYVNGKFGDKFIKNASNYGNDAEAVIEDRIITPEEHDGNPKYDRKCFAITKYIAKNLGNIAKYREVKVKCANGKMAGFEHIILENGMVIGVSMDRQVSNVDGSYTTGRDTLLSCYKNGESKVDLVLRYSENCKFIRKASGIVTKLISNDMYALHKMDDEIIDATLFID